MAAVGADVGHVRLEPFADRLDRRDLARAVVLPQAEEAAQLALEVAGRLAEALEARVAPVDGVDLDQRVDELLADAPAVLEAVERGRHRARDDVALDALHDVERRADDGLVVAHGEHGGHARAAGERRQHARLAQDVVRAGRQRAARRAAQHDVGAVAAQRVGHVGVALADRRRPRRRRRPGRGRRGRPASGSRTSSGSRSLASPSAWVRTTSSGATWVLTARNPSATVSQARRNAPDAGATTTFAGLRVVPGACRSSCDASEPSSPWCAPPLALLVPAAAQASTDQSLTFEAPRDLKDPATRDQAFKRHRRRSACTRCASCSTGTTSRPSPTRASSRSSPRPIRRATTGAPTTPSSTASRRAGGTLLLTVSGPVPRWATNGARDTLTRPSPAEFQKFVARRRPPLRHEGRHLERSGTSPTSRSSCCRSTRRTHTPLSPGIYRKLFFAAQRGLADAGLANARVLLGETSPRGTGKVVAPLTFLRGALCLDSKYHKTSKGCAKLQRRRLRPSRLHHGPGPDVQAQAAQRRHHRRALGG